MLRTPNGTELTKFSGKSVFENIGLLFRISRSLEGEDKSIYDSLLLIAFKEVPEISLKYASLCYFLFGAMLGLFVIAIGIILRYKSKNHIYANAFIFSGVITIVYYINIFYLICNNYEFAP